MENSGRRALLSLVSRLRATLEAEYSDPTGADEHCSAALDWGLRLLACHALRSGGLIASSGQGTFTDLLAEASLVFPEFFAPPGPASPDDLVMQACWDMLESDAGAGTRNGKVLAGPHGLGLAYQAWGMADRRRIQEEVRR
ncbi:MAG TPA: hypothetical protein VHB77_07140, partial [Planctomycetaceae bacterium]|nr:hypothetical protein [Planctomycetaceae bacterium]